jgi:hypothetical protein
LFRGSGQFVEAEMEKKGYVCPFWWGIIFVLLIKSPFPFLYFRFDW